MGSKGCPFPPHLVAAAAAERVASDAYWAAYNIWKAAISAWEMTKSVETQKVLDDAEVVLESARLAHKESQKR